MSVFRTIWAFFRFVLAMMIAFAAVPATATPADDLKAVIDDHWAWYLSVNPVQASALGVRTFDDRIADVSLAAMDRDAATAKVFLDRLNAVPDGALAPADRTNKGVLVRLLADQIEGNAFGQRMMLFSTYDGWHQSFVSMADTLPFRTKADYASYLTRLGLYPKLNADALAVSRTALAKGFVQPCVALGGFPAIS